MKFPDSRRLALLLMLVASPALAVPVPSPKAAAQPSKDQTHKSARPAARKAAPAPEAVNTPDSLMAAAHAAQSRGETELALRLAQSAIVADPVRPDTYDALGDVYAASGQPDFARNYYSEALSIDPTDSAALHAIAALDRVGNQRAANTAGTQGAKTGTP